MIRDDVIETYAIGGAVAAVFYIEPINTNDLDIFFHVKDSGAELDILAPLYAYLSDLGYKPEGEAINIEGWPVQFLPIFTRCWRKRSRRLGRFDSKGPKLALCKQNTWWR